MAHHFDFILQPGKPANWYRQHSPSAAVEYRMTVAEVIAHMVQAAPRWLHDGYGTRRFVKPTLRSFTWAVLS